MNDSLLRIAIAALLVALAIPAPAEGQEEREEDAVRLPGEADRYYRLGRWDQAEMLMRAELDKNPTDGNRYGLVNVLYRARKYEECQAECERLAGAKDLGMRAIALAMKGTCAWKKGDAEGARTWFSQAIQIADAKAPNAFPAARRLVKAGLAFLGWQRRESEHFAVFFPPDSPPDGDAAAFAARLEAAYEKTAAVIGAHVEGRIEAYVFRDQRQADEILGVPLGFARPRSREICLLQSSSIGYGLAHVLSFWTAAAKGRERPKSALLREGLACAFSWDPLWDRRMAELPSLLIGQGKLPPLPDLLKRERVEADLAAVGGAFLRWLEETEGREKFLRFWTEFNDHADPWTAVYGKKAEEMDAAWRASLKR